MKKRNTYQDAISAKLYAETPKAVFAAIAVSFLLNHQLEGFEDVNAALVAEWRALNAAGIVPQVAPKVNATTHRKLESATPAELRAVAMRLGRAFAEPRTAAERRALIAWILAQFGAAK